MAIEQVLETIECVAKLTAENKALRAELAELRRALEVVWKAAIRDNAPLHLDSFWEAERGAWAYLEHAELIQLKQARAALARARAEGSEEVEL